MPHSAPPADPVADQIAAAHRDNAATLNRLVAELNLDPVRQDFAPGRYTARLLHGLEADWAAHRVRRCRHLRGGPQPCVLLAWQPRRLWCWPCAAGELLAASATAEDDTCDACRAPVAVIRPVMIAVGAVVLVFGLCRVCWRVETGKAVASTTGSA